MRLPSVVSLKTYVKPSRHPAFTRFNVFLRDRFSCQYCGEREELTFDHVVPRSKGGTTTWENVVAACSACNLRKGDRLPAEVRHVAGHRAVPADACTTCTRTAGCSRPTTCTRAGWTISTGIPCSSRRSLFSRSNPQGIFGVRAHGRIFCPDTDPQHHRIQHRECQAVPQKPEDQRQHRISAATTAVVGMRHEAVGPARPAVRRAAR